MEDHREDRAAHLSDERFAELLMGGRPTRVQEHLAECAECRAEAERVACAIGDFNEQSRMWAERREAARVLRTAAQTPRVAERESVLAWLLGPRSWLLRPQAWAGAALTVALAVGIGVTTEREHSRRGEVGVSTARAEASKAQAEAAKVQTGAAATLVETVAQAKTAVQADVADESAALKADNALLSAIDGELRADESVPASLYGLTDASGSGTKTAKRISN